MLVPICLNLNDRLSKLSKTSTFGIPATEKDKKKLFELHKVRLGEFKSSEKFNKTSLLHIRGIISSYSIQVVYLNKQ